MQLMYVWKPVRGFSPYDEVGSSWVVDKFQ